MKSKRLTNHIRDRLCRLMVDKGMAEAEEVLENMEQALAERAYNACYSSTHRKAMERLQEGWLPERDEIRVNIENGSTFVALSFGSSRRFKDKTGNCALSLSPEEPLAQDIVDYERHLRDVRKQRRDLTSQVRSVLNSVSTVKRLLEVWPEAAEFTEQIDLAEPSVPAVPVQELNRLLGLRKVT